MNHFYMQEKRTVTICNYNHYINGEIHPDRILSTEHDLIYLFDGSWEIYENNTIFELKPHDFLLLHAGKHHFGKKPSPSGTKIMYIHISATQFDQQDYIFCPTHAFINFPSYIQCNKNSQIKYLFEQIIKIYWSDCIIDEIEKKYILSALVDLLLCELSKTSKTKNLDIDIVTENILKDFNNSPQRFFSPKELADTYHLSIRTISDKFKKSTGQSIHQYQLNNKLEIVKSILEYEPHRTLKNIALNLGFYDEFQLSRLFKRKFNITPSQFKKK